MKSIWLLLIHMQTSCIIPSSSGEFCSWLAYSRKYSVSDTRWSWLRMLICMFYHVQLQPWPWTTASAAPTATARQEPAPRRMGSAAPTAIAQQVIIERAHEYYESTALYYTDLTRVRAHNCQELARRRTASAAPTATALQEPAPRNRTLPT